MIRKVTFLLILGYLFLVPYCFLGASFISHDMGGAHGCALIDPMCEMGGEEHAAHGTLGEHAGMYLTLTGTTPMSAAALILALLALHIFHTRESTHRATTVTRKYIAQKKRELRALRHLVLYMFFAWLALTETSPTHA